MIHSSKETQNRVLQTSHVQTEGVSISNLSRCVTDEFMRSCCSTVGTCGFGPDYCGVESCVSNCNATAMCGKYSEGGSIKCGLNLCCSYFGWCGVSSSLILFPGLYKSAHTLVYILFPNRFTIVWFRARDSISHLKLRCPALLS